MDQVARGSRAWRISVSGGGVSGCERRGREC